LKQRRRQRGAGPTIKYLLAYITPDTRGEWEGWRYRHYEKERLTGGEKDCASLIVVTGCKGSRKGEHGKRTRGRDLTKK